MAERKPIIPKTPTVRNGNFYVLDQRGLLGIQEDVTFGPGSMRYSSLEEVPTFSNIGKVRHLLDQTRGLLGIRSFAKEIPGLLTNPDSLQRVREDAYELIGNMYGIQEMPAHSETAKERRTRIERIKEQLEDYGQVANGVIEQLVEVASPSPVSLKTTNVVKDTFDPIDLILITLDDKYSKKARFEAKRKLILMDLAAKVDQREREIRLGKNYRVMNTFLDTYIFNTPGKIGEAQDLALISHHNTKEFATTSVRTASPQDIMQIMMQPGEKVTPILQRFFTTEAGETIPVQIDTRKKDPVSKVLKMLRKGKENPAEAMGDEVGFMAVFKNRRDIRLFKKHLNLCGIEAKTLIGIQDVENSLDGSGHTPNSAGSSFNLRQDKSHIALAGIYIEAIFHTYESYTDYLYRREVGHDEFEAARYFDSGVIGLLFPNDIYPYDEEILRNSTITRIRRHIEA